jgi:superfamily I DNA/RNA helicase
LVTYFGLSNNGRHEADADVVSTLEILTQLLDYAVAGRSDKGKTFDYEGTNNGWSEAEYEKALAEYNEKVSAYVIGRRMFNYAMLVNEMIDQNNQRQSQDQSSISNEVLDKLQEIASRKVVGISDDRTSELPAARVVSELGAGSYVLDLATNRVGRSYGATGKGLVLVEFPAADYLVSGRTILEKITPSSLYNATEAVVAKDGMALDLGMYVSYSNDSGVFSGFDGIGVGVIKDKENLYRAPVSQISVLPYAGALPAEKESKETALNLIDDLLSSKTISKTFANALKKSINGGAYPRNALNNVISMLVNSREQRNIVDANKDTPSALPNSQSAADSSAVDKMKKAPKLTAKDFKDVEIDTTLIKEYLPNVELTQENIDILKAVIAEVVNKGKSLNKTNNNVRIPAYAGTGKTTMLEAIVYLYAQMRPKDNLLYLVFGKENQEEADKRLGSAGNALAKTLHSLAMNVDANKTLKAKYNKIPEQTGNSEGLNVRYVPEKVAEQFYIYEQWAGAIKDQYGVEIPATTLVQLAYNGLENWAMSAEREIEPKHFKEFHEVLALGNPSWAPGARKYLDAKDIDGIDYKKAKPGTLIGEDGIFLGLQYARKDADGKIIDVVNSLTLKNGRKIKNAEEYEGTIVVEFPENPLRNEGFFIDQLVPIAQSFWEDIISPLDTSRSQIVIDQQFIVKNWSLGNVDLAQVTLNKSGKATSALGLDRVPNALLLDEAQDINPVFVDILKRQVTQYDNGIQLVTVGDIFQSIFAFSGTINALEELPYDVSLPLTYNRRSAPELLGPANVLLNVLGSEHELKSALKGVKGNIVEPNSLIVDDLMLITRTNAGILDAAMELEVLDFYKNKTFAVTPQLKSRLLNHIDTLRYLYWDSVYKKQLRTIYDEYNNDLRDDNLTDEEYLLSKREDIDYIESQIKRNKNPGSNRPSVLIGATWESISNAVGNGNADSDTMIIYTLMSKMKDPNDQDSEGKAKPMSKGKALNVLSTKVSKYRTRNDSYQMPEEAGKAGFLGNGIAYLVKDGELRLMDGGPKDYMSDDAGVWDNRLLLETINFTRSEEMETNSKTGISYRKTEWVRPLRNPDDEAYVLGELREVYNALSGADASVLFLTGHTSKGLEESNVRLWKDWNPLYDGNDEENRPKPRKLAGESDEDYDKRIENEKKSKIDRIMNRQEFNLFYVVVTRAKQLLDLGGLAALLNNPMMIDAMRQALLKENDPDEGSAVDKMVDASAGDYYQDLNKGLMERKFSYLKSLDLSLKTPIMQRITPFRFATDADVQFEKEQTYREIAELKANPNAQRDKDETSRYGLMELLAMLEAGEGIGSLSTEDRNRLFAYLGMSSLGSSGAYSADPADAIRVALAELDRRLGIE